MFQTYPKALEELSFSLDERDLSNFKNTLEFLMINNYLTIPHEETKKALDAIDKIGQLKLEGKIYGFYAEGYETALDPLETTKDEMEKEEFDDYYKGFILFKRQGNLLQTYFNAYHLLPNEIVFKKLKNDNIDKIYTINQINNKSFLNYNPQIHPVNLVTLDEEQIKKFEQNKIKVITLDNLI